jgi:ABC-2 type transport system permease protein
MRWIGLKTLVCRECVVVLRFWRVTLAPPVIATILYFTIFGEVMGSRIGSVDGVDYDCYVAPGLIVLSVIPYSFVHTAAGLLGARLFKYIEELLVSPLPDWIILMGYVIGGVLRGLMVASVVILTSLFFTHLSVHSVVLSIAVLLTAAVMASVSGFITAAFAKSFEHVTAVQILVLTPLTYVGGVFTSISALPHWAQGLSFANPMFYVVNAFRYGVLGVSDVPVGFALTFLCAFAVVLLMAAMMLMSRGTGIRYEGSDS